MLFKFFRDERIQALFDVTIRPFQFQEGRFNTIDSSIPVHLHRVKELSGPRLLANREHNMFLDHWRSIIFRKLIRFYCQLVTINMEALIWTELLLYNFELVTVKLHKLTFSGILLVGVFPLLEIHRIC